VLLLALIEHAPERLRPVLRGVMLVPRLRMLHAFIRDLPDEHAYVFIRLCEHYPATPCLQALDDVMQSDEG
jgi:hypothetical protein